MNDYVTGGLNPDITFLLDTEPTEGLERVGSPQLQMALMPEDTAEVGRADVAGHRRFEDQSVGFHNRVRRGYLELAKSAKGWQTVDARQSIDELSSQIWDGVSHLLSGMVFDPAPTTATALMPSQE
ncbi:Thymidylate kinase [Geodia barretti]|uniref:Thymidylate kinase n=1 Tax=Geodia barretti TaxID=519541 RepID=A0AA35RTV9_GEOBA|nr:Thymidylate kinase [Geodia barretti]